MGDKKVRDLPGIGKANGRRLNNKGYHYADQVFLRFFEDPCHFMEWLNITCKANCKHQWDCYSCLNEWYMNKFQTLVPSSGHFCKFTVSVCAINFFGFDLHVRCIHG